MISPEISHDFVSIHHTDTRVNVLPLPQECIADIEVNREAKYLLPASSHSLLNTDLLRQWAFFTVPYTNVEQEANISIPVLETEGRSIPLASYQTEYGPGFLAQYIVSKGVGMSGNRYKEYIQKQSSFFNPTEPTGVFGSIGGRLDTHRSNRYIDAGIRSSLSLGTLILDHKKTKEWISQMYYDNDRICHFLLATIDTMEKNKNENLAQHIRLAGTRGRLQSTRTTITSDRFIKDPDLSGQVFLGLQNILWEIQTHPQRFQTVHILANMQPNDISEIFSRSIQTQTFTKPYEIYRWMNAFLAVEMRNILAYEKQHPNELLSYVQSVIAAPGKDIDFSFIMYDFENELDFSENLPDPVKALKNRTGTIIDQYTRIMEATDCMCDGELPDSSKETIDRMFRRLNMFPKAA